MPRSSLHHGMFNGPFVDESILEDGATLDSPPLGFETTRDNAYSRGVRHDGDRWQFRVSADKFDNGTIKLDTHCGNGSFSCLNPGHRADSPMSFDIIASANSVGSVTADEFYASIPPAYQSKGYYLTPVHEINDKDSWDGYLARLLYLKFFDFGRLSVDETASTPQIWIRRLSRYLWYLTAHTTPRGPNELISGDRGVHCDHPRANCRRLCCRLCEGLPESTG
ncbi:hypothetical protein F5I97DRAFT_423727 [Phlebopus sp. FC_14]|nr:hypothetical protein F5I97DRAFT_423727 [Phlebopus sp. FC_14]